MTEDERLSADQKYVTRVSAESLDTDQQLIIAAQRGQSLIVSRLLQAGAKISVDQDGTTAMHQAARHGFAEVVMILLNTGADVDIPDSNGATPLHRAAGHGHLDVLELLISEGCEVDPQCDMYGNTPLHEAAWHGYSKSVDLLIKNKSNPFISNRAGCTALHLAAQSGHNQSGRTLIYSGCSPDVKNNYGDTPLHTAARYGHAGVARILLSARCSVSEQNKNGDSALHISAAFKRRKIAKLLVDGGIKPTLCNNQDETASDIARRKDHMSIIEIINRGKTQPTGGIMLSYPSPADLTSSSQQSSQPRATPEPPHSNNPPSRTDNGKSGKSGGLVSWIRKKFAKEKSSTAYDGTARSTAPDDGNPGLFSQYVKRQGFAYYRDLAGNIRQGPAGFVPNCACEMERDLQINLSNHHHLPDRGHNHQVDPSLPTGHFLQSRQVADWAMVNRRNKQQASTGDQQGPHSHKIPEQMGVSTERADPFAYGVGTKQQRFGDDFDQQRISRYEALLSEQYPPPPRLFRSRSDETLSHSEYSFHGRAFKSREAAMEELKTLKHHDEIRERRRQIRTGVLPKNEISQNPRRYSDTSHQPSSSHHSHLSSKQIPTHPLSNHTPPHPPSNQIPSNQPARTASRRDLWMSTENLRDNSRSRVQQPPESDKHITSMPNRPKTPTSTDKIRDPSASSHPVDLTPLKSAMRQPRQEQIRGNRPQRPYRSSSVPRESVLPTPFNLDQKKTVRYDSIVKTTEISEDSPPSHTKQSEEITLLPVTQREAPIGAHDDKYSEQPPRLPTYNNIVSALGRDAIQRDIRDSIVNARNELHTRQRPPEQPIRNNMRPPTRAAEVRDTYHVEGTKLSATEEASFYGGYAHRNQDSRQLRIPFSGYSPHEESPADQSAANRDPASRNSEYQCSSLPRKKDFEIDKPVNERVPIYVRRAPLPSYEEVQIQRTNNTTPKINSPSNLQRSNSRPLQPPEHIGPPEPRRSNSMPSHQPASIREPAVGMTSNSLAVKGIEPNVNTNNAGSCSSSNPDSGYGGNTYDLYRNQEQPAPIATKPSVLPTFTPPPYRQYRAPPAPPPPMHGQPRGRVVFSNMTSDV